MANLLSWAETYLALGLHPIPLEPRGKRPLAAWKDYQDAPPSSDLLAEWWGREPEANIGLVLGRGICAIDLDGNHSADLLKAQGIEIPPDAPVVKTGKGWHIYLAVSEAVPDCVALLKNGQGQVDVRGVGYVVAPPSIHPSGAEYKWIRPFKTDGLPLMPAKMLELIRNKGGPGTREKDSDWFGQSLKGISKGERDVACARLAGYLLHYRLPPSAVEALLMESFAAKCQPPFTASEVRKVVDSISKREGLAGMERTIEPEHIYAACGRLWDEVFNHPPKVHATGFSGIDSRLDGGLRGGELVLVGARAGVGKTALALWIAARSAQCGTPVLYASREMRNIGLVRRIVAQVGKIKCSELRVARKDRHPDFKRDFTQVIDRLHDTPLWLTDQAISLGEIQNMVGNSSRPLGLLIVDYLQLIRVANAPREKRLQVEAVSQGLKEIAMTYDIPVICLSSLARLPGKDSNSCPTMASLRESGELEHDADAIMILHRKKGDSLLECHLEKAREGRTGVIKLNFAGEFLSFSEMIEEESNENKEKSGCLPGIEG